MGVGYPQLGCERAHTGLYPHHGWYWRPLWGSRGKILDQYIICCNGGGVELILDVIKADNRSYWECCFIT